MPNLTGTTGRGSAISQHLRATRKILQEVIFDAGIAATLDTAEVEIIERDTFEVLRLIRVWKNVLAPINKIPPEILALIPDFLDPKDLTTLTHVCCAWREVFVSRPSLWTDFDCVSGEKTRVYLERSKSFPINVSLKRGHGIPPYDPIFQIIPHATGRLKSLLVDGGPEDIRVVTSHLSHPAPLLEHLTISCYEYLLDCHPALPFTLFNGDLSSIRTLCLEAIRTELPWRNMANLTSFTLTGAAPVRQLLDFFESVPHLEEVKLTFATLTAGVQNGRLVSLARLKSMDIDADEPPSVLLDHLLIPVGTKLEICGGLFGPPIVGGHLPRSLDNLKNFSDFATIEFYTGIYASHIGFSGPNGQVNVILRSPGDEPSLTLESLGEFDTSKTKRLEIGGGDLVSEDTFYQALLPMKDLRTFTLFECNNPHVFIRALQPAASSSEAMVCPELEEIVFFLPPDRGGLDIESVIEMAAARASKGKKLGTIRIIEWGGVGFDVSELRKHVWNVECGFEFLI